MVSVMFAPYLESALVEALLQRTCGSGPEPAIRIHAQPYLRAADRIRPIQAVRLRADHTLYRADQRGTLSPVRFGLTECLEIGKRWYFNAFAIPQVVTGYDCMGCNVTVFVCGLYAECMRNEEKAPSMERIPRKGLYMDS